MVLTWWMGLGVAVAIGVGAVVSGFYWTAVDFFLDRFGTRGDASEKPA
jgi:hypothetical protein